MRPILTWPDNARVALAVILNLEHWEWEMPAIYPVRQRSGLWFGGLYADGAKNGRMMIFNLHPWVIGQPWRIRHLDEVLGHITSHTAVWKATGSEIIDWYKSRT